MTHRCPVHCKRAWLAGSALALWLASQVGLAAEAGTPDIAGENESIGKARADVEARYVSRERECRTRFVVTACIEEAKRERRQALEQLRRRQLVADEARRRERVAERRAEIAAKAAEDARHDAGRTGSAARAGSAVPASDTRGDPAPRPADGAASTSRPGPRPVVRPVPSRAQPSADERQSREASSRAAFELRQKQAAEHRNDVAERAVRQMSEKKPSAPLPVASAPLAPGRSVAPP